jgi:methionyl-tRNA formyltransferase
MRIIFAGSPAIAVPALEAAAALAANSPADFSLAGVLTNPDSPKGRGGKSGPTDIGAAAARLSAEFAAQGKPSPAVLAPEKLDTAARERIAALKPDLLVSFAYGRIFGPKFLALFPLGGINIHPSLLPAYRGPTPIPQAILNRDAQTGITIQRLALEMDCGGILLQESVPLNGRETTASLSELMAQKAALMLPEALRGLAAGTLREEPQNHALASYCSLIAKEDGLIDWNKSAAEIDARIRAFTPWPLCWTTHKGEQLFILQAEPFADAAVRDSRDPGRVLDIDKQRGILVQTGKGILAITALQYRAKKALEWRAFLNGARNFTDSVLN